MAIGTPRISRTRPTTTRQPVRGRDRPAEPASATAGKIQQTAAEETPVMIPYFLISLTASTDKVAGRQPLLDRRDVARAGVDRLVIGAALRGRRGSGISCCHLVTGRDCGSPSSVMSTRSEKKQTCWAIRRHSTTGNVYVHARSSSCWSPTRDRVVLGDALVWALGTRRRLGQVLERDVGARDVPAHRHPGLEQRDRALRCRRARPRRATPARAGSCAARRRGASGHADARTPPAPPHTSGRLVPGERDQPAQRLPAGGRLLVGVGRVGRAAVADDHVPVGGRPADVADRRWSEATSTSVRTC